MAEAQPNETRKPRVYKWILWVLWAVILISVLSVFLLFYNLSKGDLPSFEDLENPEYDVASIVYDANGKAFGKYYVENRETISFDSLSPLILNALISTEDERFYNHCGIDYTALGRVAVKSVLLGQESSGGGSTITQQLSKLLFDRPNLRGLGKVKRTLKLVEVKLKEWITAVRLEKSYTKEEIIAMYLNKFEFINGAHGIQAAAQTYFGKNQQDLKVEEAAVLVGMLKNPSLYNPIRFPEKSKNRRNTVLRQMVKAQHLTESAYDSLKIKPIDMGNFKRSTFSEGPAPYFRAELTKWLRALFKREDIKKTDGREYNIYTDGLKIHTTIDLNYQKHAEAAVWEHMKWNQERYFRVWEGRNPWTYAADGKQRKIRKQVLDRNIRATDRYQSIRQKYLGDIIAKFRERYEETPFNDVTLASLVKVSEGKSTLQKEVRQELVDDDYLDDYKEIMSTKGWNQLLEKWDLFQDAFEEDFNRKIKMKVFDYNEAKEKEVEMSPLDSVKYHNQHLQSGFLAVDPHTGYIKAWVGGVNHQRFKYDHVNSRRQVGSTIKPFVYATAIALQGIKPCQTFDDVQYTIVPGDANFDLIDEWSPANANGKFTGNKYNLYHGLLYSKNSITVRLIKEMGTVEVLRDLLRNVGIDVDAEVIGDLPAVPNLPSIGLGAVNLPLMEMVGAYTTFANNGMYTEPVFVTHIEDKTRRVLYTGIPERKVALNPLYNAVMVDMLQNNVGGSYKMGLKSQIGGKTGTTNDYADGWFIGITPELVVGTWVGGDDKWIRFLTLNDGQGFVMARPIVEKFLRKVENDSLCDYNFKATFKEPPPGFFDMVDCEKFKEETPEEEQEEIQSDRDVNDAFEEEFEEEF